MLNVDNEYDLYIDGEFVEVVNILGAVNGVAIVLVKGNPYQFDVATGKPINAPALELRKPHETDVGGLAVYIANLAANIDNDKLTDEAFRNYARTVIELMEESL